MDMRSVWQNLQSREQRLLQILAGIVVILTLYSLVISPYRASMAELQQDLQSRQQLLQSVNNAVLEKQRMGGSVAARPRVSSKDKIMQTVRTSINQQQLTASMQSINEKGRNNITVNFADVSFDAINTWLLILSQQYGINVVSLQASDKGHTGMVDLQVELGQ